MKAAKERAAALKHKRNPRPVQPLDESGDISQEYEDDAVIQMALMDPDPMYDPLREMNEKLGYVDEEALDACSWDEPARSTYFEELFSDTSGDAVNHPNSGAPVN